MWFGGARDFLAGGSRLRFFSGLYQNELGFINLGIDHFFQIED